MATNNPVIDPVCGRELDPDTAPIELMNVHGDRVFFCSVECAALFRESPETYADPEFHEHTEEARRIADAVSNVGYAGERTR
jgi:YHS domain-containing protein